MPARALSRRQELMALSGALYAQPRPDVPKLGLPGVRAPDGRFSVDIPAWPPSKSNRYRVGRGTFYADDAVHEFELIAVRAILAEFKRAGYVVDWFIPKGCKGPRALNPLFGPNTEVELHIAVVEPLRTNRDVDGTLKVLLDAGKAAGLFADDVQVGPFHLDLPWALGWFPPEATRLAVRALALPSWYRNPGKRPLSTAAAARVLATHTEDELRRLQRETPVRHVAGPTARKPRAPRTRTTKKAVGA